jgi:hypothetical protein
MIEEKKNDELLLKDVDELSFIPFNCSSTLGDKVYSA